MWTISQSRRLLSIMSLAVLLGRCGGAGIEDDGSSGGATIKEVTGAIASQSGSTDGFESWIIVLVDIESGISRVAEIDSAGKFAFKNVEENKTFTMVLLTPEFRLSSVLSMIAGDKPNKVYQYFKLKDNSIPLLEHKGSNFEISDITMVNIQKTLYASDDDDDGVPDGMEIAEEEELALTGDEDKDKVLNEVDADVDGDGIVNWFDDDDDGNGEFDVFDTDANNDGVKDISQTIGDHYFGDQIEYIAVQHYVQQDDDGDTARSLRFVVKVASGVVPTSISVRGDVDLFDESEIVTTGADGEEVGDIWNKTLLDDGKSFDQNADDGIYSRKVRLNSDVQPDANQVVFLQVVFGEKTNAIIKELPFSFPALTLDEISFSYDADAFEITKDGEPFGEDEAGDVIENYLWTVSVFDEDGIIVHSSSALDGTTESYEIDSNDLDEDAEYTAKVYAQTLSRAKGYPVYVIESTEEDLD